MSSSKVIRIMQNSPTIKLAMIFGLFIVMSYVLFRILKFMRKHDELFEKLLYGDEDEANDAFDAIKNLILYGEEVKAGFIDVEDDDTFSIDEVNAMRVLQCVKDAVASAGGIYSNEGFSYFENENETSCVHEDVWLEFELDQVKYQIVYVPELWLFSKGQFDPDQVSSALHKCRTRAIMMYRLFTDSEAQAESEKLLSQIFESNAKEEKEELQFLRVNAGSLSA